MRGEHSTNCVISYLHPKTGATILIDVRVSESAERALAGLRFYDSNDQTGRLGKVPTWPPSGFPVGSQHRYSYSPNGDMQLFTIYDRYTVHVLLLHSGIGKPGKIDWRNEGYEAHRRLGERLTRIVLANIVGEDLAPGSRSDRKDLLAWAADKGLSLRTSPQTLTTVFLYKGKRVTVPLAANQVKVGSKWVPIGGPVAAQGRRPMVPLGFERAVESAQP